MAISLSKGGNVSLSQSEPELTKIRAGLGWDARVSDGADFDLDASAFLLGGDHKVATEKHFVFYHNLLSPDGSVEHTGDDPTGGGSDGDDETIIVSLDAVPSDVAVIAITVSIHDAEARRQNFGQIRNAFIRIVNDATEKEIARYDLTEDYSTETAMIFGEVYRHKGDWKFRAVGQGHTGGLAALCDHYGISVA